MHVHKITWDSEFNTNKKYKNYLKIVLSAKASFGRHVHKLYVTLSPISFHQSLSSWVLIGQRCAENISGNQSSEGLRYSGADWLKAMWSVLVSDWLLVLLFVVIDTHQKLQSLLYSVCMSETRKISRQQHLQYWRLRDTERRNRL